MMTLRGSLLFAIFAVAFGACAASASTIVKQSGSENPANEGFTNNDGGPPYGSPAKKAWNMNTGSNCCGYNQLLLSPADEAALASHSWTLTVTMQNLSTTYGNGSGIYAVVGFGSNRFDLGLQSDGAGNQVLTDGYSGGPQQYVIPGLGTNYVTITMTFDPATDTVDYYVNGILAIANDPPSGQGDFVLFGGVDGNFRLVKLQTSK